MPPKPTVLTMAEARAELPRLTETITRKRRDREDITALYAKERLRFAGLLAATEVMLRGDRTKASDVADPAVTAAPVSPNRKKI